MGLVTAAIVAVVPAVLAVGLLSLGFSATPGNSAIISTINSVMRTSNPVSQYLYKAGAKIIDSQSICCPKYGCYSTAADWLGWSVAALTPRSLDATSRVENVTTNCDVEVTLLFNRRGESGQNTTDDISIDVETKFDAPQVDHWLQNVAGFNKSREKTVFIFPGYINRATESYYTVLRDAVLHYGDLNVFRVDFQSQKFRPYVENQIVAAKVAHFIARLSKFHGLDITKNVHFIGFSVGSHLAGFTAKAVTKLLQQENAAPQLVWKITGLDPGPSFAWYVPRKYRLDSTDAQYVEVLHTGANDIPVLVDRSPIGHVDYYFNGGFGLQPDCSPSIVAAAVAGLKAMSFFAARDFIGCSHVRAVLLYAEIIRKSALSVSGGESMCNFTGNRCASYENYNNGQCMGCGNSAVAKPASGTPPACSELTFNTHRDSIALANSNSAQEATPLTYHMYTIGEAGGYCAYNLLLELDLAVEDNQTAAYFDITLMVDLTFKQNSNTIPTKPLRIPVQVFSRGVGKPKVHRQKHVIASPQPLENVQGIKLWWTRPEELSMLQKFRLSGRERLLHEETLFRDAGLGASAAVANSTTISMKKIMLKNVLESTSSLSVLSGRNSKPDTEKVTQNEKMVAELSRLITF